MKAIVAITKEDGRGPAVDKAFGEGVYVGGERFVAFNIEGRHIYGRKVCFPLLLFALSGFVLAIRDRADADLLHLRTIG